MIYKEGVKMKVGQKVRIKKEMQLGDCVGQYVFMEELDKLKGAILEIVKVDDTDNSIEVTAGEIKIDRGYGWLDRDMVELIND